MNEDQILHKLHILSLQLWDVEKKLKILLRHSNLDFTSEDAKVQAMTEQIKTAEQQIPPQP